MASAIQSAIRLPSPEPGDPPPEIYSHESRKRSPHSRSPSPHREAPPLRRNRDSRSPASRNGPLPRDVDRARAMERARQLEMRQKDDTAAETSKPLTEEEKQAAAKAEYDRLLNMRSGGTYIPPARLRALQAQITDKTSKEYQRMAWEALKKSINGLINKVNVSNIKHIVPELFNENLIRGRGLFCRSIMKAQAASLPFTPIYAAMVAIVNTKLPQVGELLVNRLIIQFRKAFKRNDKSVCHSSTTFIAHLINQQVAHEMLAAQILLLLLHKPTDDSVEIAVGLMKEVGQHIEEMNAQIGLAVYDQFRSILHEADIDKRVQYMIEVLFQIRKDKYKDNPAVKEELDLVEEEDQITHRPGLDDQLSTEDTLNIFKFDADWEANETAYKNLKAEILGEGSDDDDNDDAEAGSDDSSSSDEEENAADKALEIKDQSNTDLVNLRRSIYLTIMSSGGFEEACHKLMRINLPSGREDELPSMIIECCSQERTYNKFFGLIGERFCKLNRLWRELFEGMFVKYYETIHRYETNRLRIIAQFFGHLLASDAINWSVLDAVHLNEEETTSSSRIFIKILIEDLAQGVGMKDLVARLKAEDLRPALGGMFPMDDARKMRFSINFFTAIGMGVLTEGMREWLKNMPKPAPAALPAPPEKDVTPSGSDSGSERSYSSYDSYSSRSDSRSRSRTPAPGRKSGERGDDDKATRRRRERSASYSSSRSRSRSRSPAPERDERRSKKSSRDKSESRSPPPPPPRRSVNARRRGDSDSGSGSESEDSRRGARNSRRQRRDYSSSRSRSPAPRLDTGDSRRRSYTRSPSPAPVPSRGNGTRERGLPPRSRDARSGRKDGRSEDESESERSSRSRSPPTRTTNTRKSAGEKNAPREEGPSRMRKRRRNSSSDEGSISPRPPAGKKGTGAGAGVDAAKNKEREKEKEEEDLSHIHPSRRGFVAKGKGAGAGGGRARASDFM